MNNPSAISNAKPNARFENARNTRASAWMFVFDCYRKKKAAEHAPELDDRNDARKESNHARANTYST